MKSVFRFTCRVQLLRIFFGLVVFFSGINHEVFAQTTRDADEVRIDVPIKSSKPLYLNHQYGSIELTGWVQDRIQVTLIRRGRTPLDEFQLITFESPQELELRVGQPRGLDLVKKLRSKKNQEDQNIDLRIKAPYHQSIRIVGSKNGSIRVSDWRGGLEIASKKNEIQLNKILGMPMVRIHSPESVIRVLESDFHGKLLSLNGSVYLQKVQSKDLLIDAAEGGIHVVQAQGRFQLNTQAGQVKIESCEGQFQIQTTEGSIYATDFLGTLQAESKTGKMNIDLAATKKKQNLNLQSQEGDILISAFADLSAVLNLSSLRGEVFTSFPFKKIDDEKRSSQKIYGPSLPGKLNVQIGQTRESIIEAKTAQGQIRVVRKEKAN